MREFSNEIEKYDIYLSILIIEFDVFMITIAIMAITPSHHQQQMGRSDHQ